MRDRLKLIVYFLRRLIYDLHYIDSSRGWNVGMYIKIDLCVLYMRMFQFVLVYLLLALNHIAIMLVRVICLKLKSDRTKCILPII